MFKFLWTVKGLFAAAQQPKQTVAEQVTSIVKGVQVSVLTDYALGKMTPSLRDRLKPSAFAIYKFTRRTKKYEKQQIRALGTIRPYYSPRKLNFLKVAKAITDRNMNPMKLLRAVGSLNKGPHMADLLKMPGVGFAVKSSGKRKVVTRLTLPGARILNKLGGRGKIYREELLDMSLGGARDFRAIKREIKERLEAIFWKSFTEHPRTKMKLL